MPRATLLRLRRGLRAAVAAIADAFDGELFAARDTNELFLGEEDGSAAAVKVDWDNILNAPGEFPPEAHGHALAEVAGLPTALAPTAVLLHSSLGGL
jgi:hypothetical protein